RAAASEAVSVMMRPRIGLPIPDGTIFPQSRPYNGPMIDEIGQVARDTPQAVLSENGPWGGRGEGDGPSGGPPDGDEGGGKEPRNPWTQPSRRRPRMPRGPGQPSLEELIRRGRERFSGGLPSGGRPIWGYALAAFALLWIATTSMHRIEPQERGVVTRLGR